MKNITFTLLSVFLLTLLFPKTSFAEFYALQDTSYWEGDYFKTYLTDSSGNKYVIERTVLDKPKYDGPSGKTAIIITKRGKNVFHKEIQGQYQLFGFSPEKVELYAFHNGQQGAEFRILNIVLFSQNQPHGKVLGPTGGFQYGSPSPDGGYCIVLDYRIFIVNLLTGKSVQFLTEYKFNNTEADPTREGKYGGNVGGSMNLSGDFLKMIWNKSLSGTLIIKNIKHDILTKIPIVITN